MQPIAETSEVIAIQSVSSGTWKMMVRSPRIAHSSKAGQFVHVRVTTGFQPFLRRPLSVGPCNNDRLTLIFTVRGKGTQILSHKKPGEAIDMIGPIGNGFTMPKEDVISILVGGGIGVVPLLLLDDRLGAHRPREFLLGVRSRAFLPVTSKEIEYHRIQIASEDGSIGFKGLITRLLEQRLDEIGNKPVCVYGCGPEPMLIVLKDICKKRRIPAQISLEAVMGCGVGACQGCAVPRADGNGYLLVCKDGPVFDMNEVDLTSGGVL